MNDEETDGSDPRMAGLLAFNQQRKQDSREKLLAASVRLFCKHGYGAVSIDDITAEAAVSRITFYRHFTGKAALALELFQQAAADGAPRMLAIATRDYRDRATVVEWLREFFEGDRVLGGILRVLAQANVEEAGFTQQVQPYLYQLVGSLGRKIPAFDLEPALPADQKRWVKAWLLVYTIMDQSNHAASDAGVARNPMMIEVLADNFLDFVLTNDRHG
ncbi:TetR/AcrR family transcriptional regulator [Sphingomonas solaris]|nr:TetR/AcrR family transcriptional regulator [Sphingomonas solaris]